MAHGSPEAGEFADGMARGYLIAVQAADRRPRGLVGLG